MSKFTVKPYIEQVLAEVSDADKLKLLNFINGKNAAGTTSGNGYNHDLCFFFAEEN